MAKFIQVSGLKELLKRFKAYPIRYAKVIKLTTSTALFVLWENVKPYPAPPTGSTYRRTGQLGRSLGVGMSGGKMGQPDIFKVTKLGATGFVGKFGSNLNYAPKVIGSPGQQDPFFAQYWWRLVDLAETSLEKITGLYQTAADELAKFLEGKGL